VIRYSGKTFSEDDIQLIKEIIAANPQMTRAALSREVCRQLKWYKPDGGLKEMRCRVVMIKMHNDLLIKLPKAQNCLRLNKAIRHTSKTDIQNEIVERVDFINDIKLRLVDKTNTSLWNEYIDRYHYLGFKKLPGAQLRYFAYAGNQIIACLGFGAAAWKTAPRDQFIGWNSYQKEKNLHLVINNTRFLILPWIKSKNLASKLLSMIVRQLPVDWQNRYKYKPVLIETFVESKRFLGTCYKAANWVNVGKTKGRGRNDIDNKYSLPIKDIFLLPITKDFRKSLCA